MKYRIKKLLRKTQKKLKINNSEIINIDNNLVLNFYNCGDSVYITYKNPKWIIGVQFAFKSDTDKFFIVDTKWNNVPNFIIKEASNYIIKNRKLIWSKAEEAYKNYIKDYYYDTDK